jgi:hypothetical protein
MEETQIIDKPKIYQALGIVSGILELTEEHYSSLLIGEQTYFATVSPKVRKKHQPGQVQNFKIYPAIREGKLGFSLRAVTQKAPREAGILIRGCWEIYGEEPHLVIHRNLRTRRATPTALPLIWKEAPVADGQYWEIEAKLKGDKFEVVQAIGPFDAPRKYQKRVKKSYANAKSDLPRPILKSAKPIKIKSELPPPTLKSARTAIAALPPKAIEPPESEPIIETASEPIVLNASTAIEETTSTTKSAEVSEPITASEIKAIAETAREPIAIGASGAIEPEEPEASPVVVEPVTPKTKKASGKSSASKKLSIAPETAEPKKTKEKVKASSSKKPMSLAADRLFLGKQLPPGK